MTTTSPTRSTGQSVRTGVQKFGTFLSGMIMPNIAAFIAWGLLTALFIPKGYLPNAELAGLVAPVLYFLLPLLIANTGGRMVYDGAAA
jgi:PTS system mannitol-specific IIC component